MLTGAPIRRDRPRLRKMLELHHLLTNDRRVLTGLLSKRRIAFRTDAAGNITVKAPDRDIDFEFSGDTLVGVDCWR